MKPETIERRRRELAESRAKSHAALIERLEEIAQRDPGGIWSELLDEAKARIA